MTTLNGSAVIATLTDTSNAAQSPPVDRLVTSIAAPTTTTAVGSSIRPYVQPGNCPAAQPGLRPR
jgi:hypothetical protein